MSANTSPDNITYPVSTDQIAPLETVFATLATSVQLALTAQAKYFIGTVATQAARDAIFPNAVQGNRIHRSDLGYTEAYYGLYNVTTNPSGATPAGWYPIDGAMPMAIAKRSASGATFSHLVYNDATTNAFWTTQSLYGGFTVNNGFVVPVSGVYRLNATIHTTGSAGDLLAGFYTGALPSSVGGMRGGTVSGTIQTNNLANIHLVDKFTAGEIIKISTLTTAATATWAANSGSFSAEFVAPAK